MMRIIITAPKGKMDSLILEEAVKDDGLEPVGLIGPAGRDYIGTEICGVKVYDDLGSVIENCDLVIDYSNTELSKQVLKICMDHGKALICGTTGFRDTDNEMFREAAEKIPVLKAANTSYMVNVMMKMAALAAEKLAGKCKMEILDLHDEKKADAPSGTALELGEILAEAAMISVDEIDHHSVRAGDIPSSHTIYFGGIGERIELTHHAYNWKCYAAGACSAAKFLEGKAPGLYLMSDVVDD
ncbi:MAG: 4-hydroxy-tetrahydrodipicolinate reductase [Eubacteriaceae bacterium]|nr:4-hydroxy-tetrahydrodipicolinate reductase [Eubacteriaceae bacterium]